MKKLTYTGEEAAVEVVTDDFVHVLRPGGSVEVTNDVGAKYEGRDDFTVRDLRSKSAKKGGES